MDYEFGKMDVIAYMRVSLKTNMTVENQRPILEKWVRENVDNIGKIKYVEEEESSGKFRPKRDACIKMLLNKEYNTLVCVRIDRWGRNTVELLEGVNQLIDNGCRIVFVGNCFDFYRNMSPTNTLILTIFAAFAQFEKEIMKERIKEGMARAANDGRYPGRPKGAKDKSKRRKSGYYIRWDREHTKVKDIQNQADIDLLKK